MQLSAIFRFQVMNADDKNTGDGVTVTKFGNPTFNRVDLPGGGALREKTSAYPHVHPQTAGNAVSALQSVTWKSPKFRRLASD